MLNVEEKYPSICYSCENARKPAADSNQEKGYVGCALRVMPKYQHPDYDDYDEGYDHYEIESAKEVTEMMALNADATGALLAFIITISLVFFGLAVLVLILLKGWRKMFGAVKG